MQLLMRQFASIFPQFKTLERLVSVICAYLRNLREKKFESWVRR